MTAAFRRDSAGCTVDVDGRRYRAREAALRRCATATNARELAEAIEWLAIREYRAGRLRDSAYFEKL